MAAPTEVLKIGTLPAGGNLQRADITVRDDGFDDGYLVYITDSRDTYTKGSTTADYPGMTIREIKSSILPGDEYELTLRVQGLSSGTNRMINSGFVENADGFDTGSETWLARTNSAPVSIAAHATGYSHMICISVDREILPFGNPRWARWNCRFMGSLATKPYKRRITVDGNVISNDSLVVNLPGGWTTARKSQVDLSRVVIEDSQVQTFRPNTFAIPAAAVPPSAPAVYAPSISGSSLTYHWPSGWVLKSIGWDEIPGTSIGIATYRYEFVLSPTF